MCPLRGVCAGAQAPGHKPHGRYGFTREPGAGQIEYIAFAKFKPGSKKERADPTRIVENGEKRGVLWLYVVGLISSLGRVYASRGALRGAPPAALAHLGPRGSRPGGPSPDAGAQTARKAHERAERKKKHAHFPKPHAALCLYRGEPLYRDSTVRVRVPDHSKTQTARENRTPRISRLVFCCASALVLHFALPPLTQLLRMQCASMLHAWACGKARACTRYARPTRAA